MLGYLVSLLMGLAVGASYGLVQVRSPAPRMIALECWKPRSDRLGVSLEIEQGQVGFHIVHFD